MYLAAAEFYDIVKYPGQENDLAAAHRRPSF